MVAAIDVSPSAALKVVFVIGTPPATMCPSTIFQEQLSLPDPCRSHGLRVRRFLDHSCLGPSLAVLLTVLWCSSKVFQPQPLELSITISIDGLP